MSDRGLNDYPLNLKAGKWQKLAVPGDFIQIIEATGFVYLRTDSGASIKRRANSGQPVITYQYIEVMSAADQFVRVSLGFIGGGAPYDSGAIFAGTVNVHTNQPTLRSSPADVSIPAGERVQVALNDVTRISIIVELDDMAAGPVRVGDSACDDTHGLKLNLGDAGKFNGPPGVYVFNPNASAVTVHLDVESAP